MSTALFAHFAQRREWLRRCFVWNENKKRVETEMMWGRDEQINQHMKRNQLLYDSL